MNQKKTSKLTYLVLALVVATGLFVYFYMSGNKTPESITLQEIDSANQVAGVRILNLLNEISALSIDNTFFTDPAYQTLVDYTVEIPPVSVGRPNPFSPIPGLALPAQGGR